MGDQRVTKLVLQEVRITCAEAEAWDRGVRFGFRAALDNIGLRVALGENPYGSTTEPPGKPVNGAT